MPDDDTDQKEGAVERESKVLRRPDGTFMPGHTAGVKFQPGNPGRPPGVGFSARMSKALLSHPEGSDRQVVDALVQVLLHHALKGSAKHIEMILDRIEGKVADRIAGHDGGPLTGTPVGQLPEDAQRAIAAIGRSLIPPEPTRDPDG